MMATTAAPATGVVHLIAPAAFGGAESVVLALAAADAPGTHVLILRSSPAGVHPLTEQLRARNVPVEELVVPRRAYGAQARRVREALRRRQATLLHTHGYHANVVGWLAARSERITLVSTVHGYLARDFKERLYDRLDRWVLRRFDAVAAVSESLRAQLVASGVPPAHIMVVANGMDADAPRLDADAARRALDLPSDRLVVGWTGRLSHEKGADLLLAATRMMRSTCCVALIGDGPERPVLEEQAAAIAAADGPRARFLGAKPSAGRFLPAFDVLVISSRREGSPMIVLEAAAAGVPIVAFRVGGIGELLDESSAWLVPAGDTQGLAAALDDALADAGARAQRAATARQRLVATHGMGSWRARMGAVYEAAKNRRRPQ